MPTYEYCCNHCENVFDVFHSYKETPEIKCPLCSSPSKKQVSGFYLSSPKTSVPVKDMKQDLKDNYGIHQLEMQSGTFNNFYHGVKKDGDRVREQMKRTVEENEKKQEAKNREFMKKPTDMKAILKNREIKAQKEFKKRSIRLP